jgi:hypothetical protein
MAASPRMCAKRQTISLMLMGVETRVVYVRNSLSPNASTILANTMTNYLHSRRRIRFPSRSPTPGAWGERNCLSCELPRLSASQARRSEGPPGMRPSPFLVVDSGSCSATSTLVRANRTAKQRRADRRSEARGDAHIRDLNQVNAKQATHQRFNAFRQLV